MICPKSLSEPVGMGVGHSQRNCLHLLKIGCKCVSIAWVSFLEVLSGTSEWLLREHLAIINAICPLSKCLPSLEVVNEGGQVTWAWREFLQWTCIQIKAKQGTAEWVPNPWVPTCSVVTNSVALWTVPCQALWSMGYLRQEYWSGLPFPSPGGLADPGTEPHLLHLLHRQVDSSPQCHLGSLPPPTPLPNPVVNKLSCSQKKKKKNKKDC